MLVVVFNPLCPVWFSLLLYCIYFCFSVPNKTISNARPLIRSAMSVKARRRGGSNGHPRSKCDIMDVIVVRDSTARSVGRGLDSVNTHAQ